MVEHFPTGNINAVENSGNFAANDTQFAEFCCGYPRRAKMSDKDIGMKRCCDQAANGRQNQVSRLSTIAFEVERLPGIFTMNAA